MTSLEARERRRRSGAEMLDGGCNGLFSLWKTTMMANVLIRRIVGTSQLCQFVDPHRCYLSLCKNLEQIQVGTDTDCSNWYSLYLSPRSVSKYGSWLLIQLMMSRVTDNTYQICNTLNGIIGRLRSSKASRRIL